MQTNRETYLQAATDLLRPVFSQYHLSYGRVNVSCGFTSRGKGTARRMALGEHIDPAASAAGVSEVFISPVLARTDVVLGVLVHELIHAAVGNAAGHRGPFVRAAKAMLLEGKPTATVIGDQFRESIAAPIIANLGEYPHATVTLANNHKKQKTRQLKVECQCCGYIARVSRTTLDTLGAPICPACHESMTEPGDQGEEGDLS